MRLRDEILRTLNLEQQGLFALGYYQQLANLKAGKKSGDKLSESSGVPALRSSDDDADAMAGSAP